MLNHVSNRGVAAARNTGLDNASGEYIYYVDADDYIEENAMELMAEEIIKRRQILLVATGTYHLIIISER